MCDTFTIICCLFFVSYPLLLSILYEGYNRIYDFKYSELCDDFAFISSFYLVLKLPIKISCLLVLIPFVLSLTKKRYFSSSAILIMSIITFYNIYSGMIILEYILYLLLFYFFKNKSIYIIMINKIILYVLFFMNKVSGINLLLFIILYIIICVFYKKASGVLNYKEEVRKILEEKDVRVSLFKITHEIKNPITVCKGYLDMIDLNDKDKSMKYIDIINDEINHVLVLLEDFLSINKIKIEKDIMDINLLLEEVTDNFIPLLKNKKIKKNFNISKDELYIEADYNRISQVIINVLKNSIESIGENGCINLWVEEHERFLKIYIEDNGSGMSKEQLEQIKKPFFTTKEKGTGLGVFLSNQIIEAHNGSITYISKENIGTKTIIKLPKN